MKYKERVERSVETALDKVLILERMVEGRTPSNQQLGSRVLKELRHEIEQIQETVSLER